MIIWKTEGSLHELYNMAQLLKLVFVFFSLSCDEKNLSPEEKCVYVSEALDTL